MIQCVHQKTDVSKKATWCERMGHSFARVILPHCTLGFRSRNNFLRKKQSFQQVVSSDQQWSPGCYISLEGGPQYEIEELRIIATKGRTSALGLRPRTQVRRTLAGGVTSSAIYSTNVLASVHLLCVQYFIMATTTFLCNVSQI